MEQKIILFDIDLTLIDTSWYYDKDYHNTTEFLRKYYPQLDPEKLWEDYIACMKEELRHHRITMKNVVKIFSERNGLDLGLSWSYFKNFYETLNWEELVFKGAEDLLENLRAKGFRLGIFSEGDIWFQEIKLRSSGLQKFFHEDLIFITRYKLDALDTIPKGVVIIDDSERVIKGLRSQRPDIHVIHVDGENGVSGLTVEEIVRL